MSVVGERFAHNVKPQGSMKMDRRRKKNIVRAALKGRGMRIVSVGELASAEAENHRMAELPNWPGLAETQIVKTIDFWRSRIGY